MAGNYSKEKAWVSQASGAQEPLPEDMAAEIDRVSHDDVLTGPAGAAVRSMLISAVIMGGAYWLARLLFGRGRSGDSRKKNG